MDSTLTSTHFPLSDASMALKDQQISETIRREQGRLKRFIRRRVFDSADAEDIFQDVVSAFVEAYRLPAPIEQAGAWLLQVARNRIIDRFRKKREAPLPFEVPETNDESTEPHWLDETLASLEDSPETAYSRAFLLEAVAVAIEALPARQREVFIAHEIDGLSFKEISASTGIGINTLLGQKRQAVLALRSRLDAIVNES